MKDLRRGLQHIACIGGIIVFVYGCGSPNGAGIAIAGSIFTGCALIAMAIDRE
jgi:hypothetical protein